VVEQPPPGSSTLLIDEYFEAGDDRFLAEVLASRSDKKLLSLAERWFWDPRPFARRMLLAYVDDGCDRPHHRPLVKRLFKQSEAAGDHEIMGHFMVAFDRLVRRELVQRREYDWGSRSYLTQWVLQSDPTVLSRAPKPKTPRGRVPPIDRFTARTRRYLCRRAFRYFRTLGHRDPPRYGAAVRAALLLYEDAHLGKPEQLLDAWGLVHVLYHGSPVLVRSPHGVRLAEGARLSDLAPAPIYPEIWKDSFDGLLALVEHAASRTVRGFAIEMLERHHVDALRALPFARLRNLLRVAHDEVQSFAARRLKETTGLENLPLSEWLELLQVENPEVVPLVRDLVRAHVHPDRLTLAQSVELAKSGVAAVAELGLAWARSKAAGARADLETLVSLRDAATPRVRAEAMSWVVQILGESPLTEPAMVRDLIDGKYAEARAAGLAVLDRRFKDETALWAAMSESPYDDVRVVFVRHLAAWEETLDPASLHRVWATSLLAIHRGGRAKQRVVAQVAERIVRRPADAESLLPLLGIALRSVRVPERRAGLAAIARAAFREPGLRAAIERRLPELRLSGLGPA
jgi:hypothetical protein